MGLVSEALRFRRNQGGQIVADAFDDPTASEIVLLKTAFKIPGGDRSRYSGDADVIFGGE